MKQKDKETVKEPYPGHLDFNFQVSLLDDPSRAIEIFLKEINTMFVKQNRQISARPPFKIPKSIKSTK